MLRRVMQSCRLWRSALLLRYSGPRVRNSTLAALRFSFRASHPQAARLRGLSIFLGSVFLLSGCVAPRGEYAEFALPDIWTEQGSVEIDAADVDAADGAGHLRDWWKRFDDEVLNNLIAAGLENSPQRNIAQARILEARGYERTSRSGFFPQIGASGAAGRNETAQRKAGDYYDAGFDASFELDVFGQVRTRASAASAQVEALEAGYHDVSLTLIADIARAYIDYRAAQTQVQIAEKNLFIQEKTLELVEALTESGESPQLDVERADALVNGTRASIPAFSRAADNARLRLSTLVGLLPADVTPILNASMPIPGSKVLPVLRAPATVLEARPDVRAAQAQFEAATHLADAAVRDLFPSISLSSFFGVTDNALVSGKTIWDVAANAAVTVLDFGRLEGAIDASRAVERQAYESYRLSILAAVVEVETALSDYAHLNKERVARQASFESAQRAFKLSTDLYEEGEVSFLDVLDSQRELNSAEADLVAAQAAQSESLVRLYKSLGVY